jgi:hypothetical protein
VVTKNKNRVGHLLLSATPLNGSLPLLFMLTVAAEEAMSQTKSNQTKNNNNDKQI